MTTPSLNALLEDALRRARREPVWRPGPATRVLEARGDALLRLLAQRPPFVMIDEVSSIDPQQRAVSGRRRLDPADPVFAGHFPGRPVYPGVLLVETIAQLGAAYQTLETGGALELVFATAIRAALLRPVHPGDDLVLRGRFLGAYDGLYERFVGQALRGDEICAAAIVEGCHVDP